MAPSAACTIKVHATQLQLKREHCNPVSVIMNVTVTGKIKRKRDMQRKRVRKKKGEIETYKERKRSYEWEKREENPK